MSGCVKNTDYDQIFKIDSVFFSLHNNNCAKLPQNCSATTQDGYSVPAIQHGKSSTVSKNGQSDLKEVCTAEFSCNDGRLTKSNESCCFSQCKAGFTSQCKENKCIVDSHPMCLNDYGYDTCWQYRDPISSDYDGGLVTCEMNLCSKQ